MIRDLSDFPTVRVGEKTFSVFPELMTAVTDGDILGEVGSFTPSPDNPFPKEPYVAYEVRGLDPSRWVAFHAKPLPPVEAWLGDHDTPQPTRFKTTGWNLAFAEGAFFDEEICPYIRAGFKDIARCP